MLGFVDILARAGVRARARARACGDLFCTRWVCAWRARMRGARGWVARACAAAACAARLASANATRASAVVFTDGYDVASGDMRLRFTHDVEYEALMSDGVSSSAVGNPGMIYARVEEMGGARSAGAQSLFMLGARDALVVEMRTPPAQLVKYWSFVTYVYRRNARVVSAHAGWPVNSANAGFVSANGGRQLNVPDSSLIIVATRDARTFDVVVKAYENLGYPRRAVNAQPLSPNVRFGRARISGADLLTTSFRVAYWPGSPDDIALGEWSKLEHRAYIVRGPGNGNESPIEAMDADSPPPSVVDASSLAPSSSSSSANIRLSGEPPSSLQQQQQPLSSLNYVRGARKVGETSMSPVRVDSNRCLAEPGYNPWSVHGVNVRSGCFGSTPDCLYSVSREFFRRDSMREFVVVVSGITSGATFTNFALYASGSQMSSAVSARDIRIIAAIDDRSFATRTIPDGTNTTAFVAAFASSPDGCERAAPTPCAVARAPPSRRSHIFIVGRDYLDPITATAPVNRPAVRVEIFAIA